MSDGGCVVATVAPNDVSLDSLSLPASAGGSVVLRFDATGTAIAGSRVPTAFTIGRLGDRIYGAIACTSACTIGGTAYTPSTGSQDIVFASFDSAMTGTVIGTLTGGAAGLDRFAAIEPDMLAVSFQAGPQPVGFGGMTLAPNVAVNALAAFGI